jgi:hypothetical protein
MNPVKELGQVDVDDPLATFLHILFGFGDGRVAATSRSKAVATPVERRLVVGAEHLVHRLLDEPVDHIGDAEAALTAPRLGDPHTADHPWPVVAVEQLAVEHGQNVVEVLVHLLDGPPIGSGGSFVRRDVRERCHQVFVAGYLHHRHGRRISVRCALRLRHRARRR